MAFPDGGGRDPFRYDCLLACGLARGIAGVGSASVTGLEAIEPTRLQLAGTSAAAFKSFGAFEAAQLPAAAATAFENQPT